MEFNPQVAGETAALRLEARLAKLVNQIKSDVNKEADIIVLPEYALEEVEPLRVSNPVDKVTLCGNITYDGNPLQKISCAAQVASTYVVLNVLTQHNCTQEKLNNNDTRPCASNDTNVYNSNVVFDRNGAVISMYE